MKPKVFKDFADIYIVRQYSSRRITMGLSASQARFLELTARKSNVEYQAQRINFERLQLADKSAAASQKYNEAMSNRKLTYSFYAGAEKSTVDLTYANYKSYMNQQDTTTSSQKMYLVSSSGNKIIVANEEEMQKIIDDNTENIPATKVEEARRAVEEATGETAETVSQTETEGITSETSQETTQTTETTKKVPTPEELYLASKDFSDYQMMEVNGVLCYTKGSFSEKDFIIAPDLDDVDNFQKAIKDGVYFFATYGTQDGEKEAKFKTLEWETLGGGAITEVYDKSDDPVAQAEYDQTQSKIQSMDKKLELQLDKLNTEREAIETEMESVQKVIENNVESSFKVFS